MLNKIILFAINRFVKAKNESSPEPGELWKANVHCRFSFFASMKCVTA